MRLQKRVRLCRSPASVGACHREVGSEHPGMACLLEIVEFTSERTSEVACQSFEITVLGLPPVRLARAATFCRMLRSSSAPDGSRLPSRHWRVSLSAHRGATNGEAGHRNGTAHDALDHDLCALRRGTHDPGELHERPKMVG